MTNSQYEQILMFDEEKPQPQPQPSPTDTPADAGLVTGLLDRNQGTYGKAIGQILTRAFTEESETK